MKSQASFATKAIREVSFMVRGPKIFNNMPQDRRKTTDCRTDSFKPKPDKYPGTIQIYEESLDIPT